MNKEIKNRVIELQSTIADAKAIRDWAITHLETYPDNTDVRELLEQKNSVIARATSFIEAVTNGKVGA